GPRGRLAGGERLPRDLDHVFRTLREPAPDLERAVRDRAAHLPGQLGPDLVGAFDHPRHHAAADGRPFRERHLLPRRLPGDGAVERPLDGVARRRRVLGVDRAVDRAEDALHGGTAHSGVTYAAVMPPSTRNSVPVTNDDSVEAR